LGEDRAQGFSVLDEELERGLRAIAMPVMDRGDATWCESKAAFGERNASGAARARPLSAGSYRESVMAKKLDRRRVDRRTFMKACAAAQARAPAWDEGRGHRTDVRDARRRKAAA